MVERLLIYRARWLGGRTFVDIYIGLIYRARWLGGRTFVDIEGAVARW